MNLQIREYAALDFDEIDSLWISTGMGGRERGDVPEVIEKTIQTGGKLFLLEDSATKEIIGTSWLTNDGRRIYLHHFGIKPLHQGKGYSKILLKESLKFAQASGMQIKLEVHRNNRKAIELYENGGFSFLGDYDVYIIRNYEFLKYQE